MIILARTAAGLSGYRSQVPHAHRKIIIEQIAILQTSHKFICGTIYIATDRSVSFSYYAEQSDWLFKLV